MTEQRVPDKKCHEQAICHNNTGSALLEVILSLFLSLLLIEILLQLTLMGITNIVNAGQRTIACTYADSLLEEMKARPDLLQGVSLNTSVPASDLAFFVSVPANMQAEIQLLPLEGTEILCQVHVKVVSTEESSIWEEKLIGLIPSPKVHP